MPPSDPSDPPSLEHVESQQPNLSVLFNKCVYGFAEVLRIISAGQTQPVIGADAPVISPAELDRAFDEYGRLKVWGHDFRASLPDLTRSSLGETLHRHGELRDQVASIFLLLDKEITSVLDLLSRGDYASSIVDDQALGDNDHSSSNSDSGSDSESDISGTDDNPRHGPKRSIISRRMAAVFDQIKLLYYLGILLQRPGLSRKYLKSGSNTLDATSEDISHVWETIKRWQKEPDQHVGIDPVDEKAVTREEIQRRTKSSMGAGGVSTQLIERLARANTRRREQLAYWSEHPDQTFAQNVDEVQVPDRPAQHYSAKKAKSVISTGTSLFSKNTVAFSDIAGVSSLRQSDDGPARTIYEETVVGGTHSSRVPSVPEESNFGDTFECPYSDDENGYESASTSTPDKESAQLEDLDWHARVDAIDALSRRSALPEAILQAIAAGLGDQDVRVRCAAVNALGRQPALPGEMLKALIDLQEMLQASVDLPLGHENPEGSKDGEVASNFLTAPDTNKGVELGDKEDDAGFTVVKTRQKQRLKPNEREVPNRRDEGDSL
ncbi:hypothetical protein CDV36_011975 [Fusarium kuroshium]|uniref:Uncharacterized protein n=1 Tax=Fusarium kuroshium TaxID=2010991 RepID=A0A3M2RSU7_9HYPO|nr:hypothetical protein CDV36_011975 [Fusarium kuroshium]